MQPTLRRQLCELFVRCRGDLMKGLGACASFYAHVLGLVPLIDNQERLWAGLLLATAGIVMVPIGMRWQPQRGDWLNYGSLAASAFVSRLGAFLGFWW